MFGSSYKIMTVWGIPIKIHISLIVLLVFVAFAANQAGGTMAIVEMLLLETLIFASIALHELGHSFVAIRKGCRVREITLLFIGGAAQMEDIPRKPRDEFQMAIAGPAVSLLLCVGFWELGAYLPLPQSYWPFPLWPRLLIICNFIQFIGVINLSLAIFNLLPSFPMDGGRVLRAALSPKLGRLRATYVAARIGRFVAMLFGIAAVLPVIAGKMYNAAAGARYETAHLNWALLIIAVFIFSAAGNEYRMVKMQEEEKKRGGFTLWAPFYDEPPPLPPEDPGDVIISPPPYEKGPNRKTEIHSAEDDNPFRDMFGHR